MSVTDHLAQVWSQVLGFLEKIVTPDWGSLIGLIPLLLLIGLIGPLLSLAVLIWMIYFARKPRTTVHFEEGPRAAVRDASGAPIFPVGEPYCLRHGQVYPPGSIRCDSDGEALAVLCPMCGIGRDSAITTCGNCGLVLKIEPRARVMRPAGPPPGGAAVA